MVQLSTMVYCTLDNKVSAAAQTVLAVVRVGATPTTKPCMRVAIRGLDNWLAYDPPFVPPNPCVHTAKSTGIREHMKLSPNIKRADANPKYHVQSLGASNGHQWTHLAIACCCQWPLSI